MSRLVHSLQTRLLLLMILVILPVVMLLVFKIVEQRNLAIDNAKQKAVEVVKRLADDQAQLVVDTKNFLEQLADFKEIQQLETPGCSVFVSRVLRMGRQYVNIGVPRADGELLCNAFPLAKPVNVADRPYIRRAMDNRTFSMGEFQMDRAAGVTSVNFAYPVISPSSDQLLGAVVAVVSLDWWSKRLAGFRLPDHSIAYIADADGSIIAYYPANHELLGQPATELDDTGRFPIVASDSMGTPVVATRYDESRILVSTQLNNELKSRPITVGVGIPFALELSAIKQQTLYGALLLLGFVILSCLMAIRGVRRSILKPLEELSLSTSKLADGISEQDISYSGAAELIELQKQFASMAKTRLIAEKKLTQSQAELRESENYNRTLVDTSPIGLVLSTMNCELIDVNAKFAEIIGYSTEEALQLTFWSITPEKYHETERQQLELLETHGCYGPYEKDFIHRDGSTVPVRLFGRCLKRNGKDYIWSCVEDISKLKQLEEQVRRSQKMDAVGSLAGGIAHDFNNILGIIQGYLELTRQSVLGNEKAIKRIDSALDATRRGAKLTRKLLSFSRVEERELVTISVNPFIERLVSFIAKSLTASIQVKTNLADDLWPVLLDPQDFEDAILNLSLNARDAMPNGGTLVIETVNKHIDGFGVEPGLELVAGNFVMMSISDTGTGMTEETRERLFEPFFTTKERDKGTGLGLSMVYGFVKRSGGYIKVYSEQDEGTTFSLFFPRAAGDSDVELAPQAGVTAPLGSEAILVVDDEDALRDVAATYLSDLGYTVFTADCGESAIQRLIKNPEIALVFSDVIMPGEIDGYQLALACHEVRPDIRVLLTSGYTKKLQRYKNGRHAYLSGLVSNLLHKPYGRLELAIRIRQTLDNDSETGTR